MIGDDGRIHFRCVAMSLLSLLCKCLCDSKLACNNGKKVSDIATKRHPTFLYSPWFVLRMSPSSIHVRFHRSAVRLDMP